jgi:hypothetical protein
VLAKAILGTMTPRSLSSGIPLHRYGDDTFNTTFDEAIGRTSYCDTEGFLRFRRTTPESLAKSAPTVGFGDRVVYDIPNGKIVTFWVNKKADILFYCGSGEAYSSDVRVAFNQTANTENGVQYSLTGQTDDAYILKPNEFEAGYISISNRAAGKCYLMGVNIVPLEQLDLNECYDAFIGWQHDTITNWLGPSNGANDIAMRIQGGKTFASWHGGHSNEILTLGTESGNLTSDEFPIGEFILCENARFVSETDITDGRNTGHFRQLTDFSNSGHRIQTSVIFDSAVTIDNCYSGMTINNNRFSQLQSNIIRDLTKFIDGDDIDLGITSTATLVDPDTLHSIETRATWFTHDDTEKDGPYIRVRTGDYKFYLNSLYDADKKVKNITAVTYHYFDS